MKKNAFIFVILVISILFNTINTQDPFAILGIPSLNPSSMFSQDERESEPRGDSLNTNSPRLLTIEDLPKYLQSKHITKNDGIEVVSRFLLSDDFALSHKGVVFDQTNFSGLVSKEAIAAPGTKERLMQRARSAAKIYFKSNFKDPGFDPYGAEEISSEYAKQKTDWKIYKVLLVGQKAEDHSFIMVCLPLNEMLVPICSQLSSDCARDVKLIIK